MAKNSHNKTSKVLLRKVPFENQKMTVKSKIDLLINNRGFITKEVIDYKNIGIYPKTAYRLSNGEKKYVFDRVAEKEYIDKLFKEKGISTIPKAEKVPSQRQNLKKGAVLIGPDHEHGGIDILINETKVANAQGNEIVINAAASETHCEELSRINQSAGNGIAFDCTKNTQMEQQIVTAKRGTKLCSEGLEVESLLFDKKIYSLENSMDWIYRHNYINATDVDETKNEYRFRQQEPEKFDKESYITKKFTNGIQAVMACPIKKAEKGAQISSCGCHHADQQPFVVAKKGAIINMEKYQEVLKKNTHQAQYNINQEIEALIDKNGDNQDNYTSEEKNSLRFYSGYGGLVSEDITLEQAKQSFTEYYTPDLIVQKMWALAYKYGFKDGQSVLEPSVGTGQFLKYVPSQSMATGYEINKYSYTICKVLYPKFNFFLQPFEEIFIKNRDSIKSRISDLPKYDLVIGNPPYGDVGGFGMGMGEKSYTRAGNWIEYFLLRGLDLTAPGGLLIYIVGTEVANGGIPFLQQGTSKTKEMIAERADLINAYRLPNGVFERTDVLTDILVFKRKNNF